MNDKIKCPYCNNEYSKFGLGSHIKHSHNDKYNEYKKKKRPQHQYICPYCGKECNKYGLNNHIRLAHFTSNMIGHPAWNKGLTKETDDRVLKYTNTLKEGYQSGRIKPSFTKETMKQNTKEKLSSGAKNSLSKSYFTENKPSPYEKRIIDILEQHKFKCILNYKNILIDSNNKTHHYKYDIAILDLLINIECDGWQHDLPTRINDDKLRDELSINDGWVVLRLKNKKMEKMSDEEIWAILSNFINQSKQTLSIRKNKKRP